MNSSGIVKFRCAFAVMLALVVLPYARGEEDMFTKWWNSQTVTGDMLGVRPAMQDHGLAFNGRWRGVYYGILSSENGSGNAFPQELAFNALIDLAKATKWETLAGFEAFVQGRWRDPAFSSNPNNIVDGDGFFNPSRYSGGVGWRLMTFGAQYVIPELLGYEDAFILRGGWIQPQQEFIDQPLARLFAANSVASADGLGGNIPFSSSFTTWGGTIAAKPQDWYYAKTGLFMSFFNPTDPTNQGMQFGGDPETGNGLFFLGETGLTPRIGPAELPGHYAFGGYFYGENNEEFGGNKFGFYWQADQMLWRESEDQGLSLFSLWVFAPKYNNDFSFYAHGGLVYEGAIPTRDEDQLMAVVAVGQYSYYDLVEARADGDPEPNQTVLIEAGYRFKLNGWSFVQPFAQYIVQPDGTTAVANAAILGLFFGIDF